jgi:hypothetical protein
MTTKLVFQQQWDMRVNGDTPYYIYENDIKIGEMARDTDSNWRLKIRKYKILLRGQYRNDLIDEAEIRVSGKTP